MGKKPETRFKEKVFRWFDFLIHVEKVEIWYTKVQQVGIRGTPDILLCLYGDFWAIELKRNQTECADRLQTHQLEQIKKAGGYACVLAPEQWEHFQAVVSKAILAHRSKKV